MSFHQKIVRNCKNPHVGLRRETSMRALLQSHRSCFVQFVPAEELTEKQQLLLEGKHPSPRKNQVTVLLQKMRHYNRLEEAELVFEQYKHFYHEVNDDDLALEKALNILRDLTPDELK